MNTNPSSSFRSLPIFVAPALGSLVACGQSCTVLPAASSKLVAQAVPANGTYKLLNVLSGKALDVSGGSLENGARVQQWTDNGTPAQQWNFERASDGSFKIKNVGSGKVLDVTSASSENAAPLTQWTDYGNPNQRFAVSDLGNSVVSLTTKHSAKLVETGLRSLEDGGVVRQWDNAGLDSQKWKMVALEGTPNPGPTPPPTPTEAYRWKNVEVGGGGLVTGIAVHPKVQNLVYVRTDVGGIYRWNEASSSWIPLFDGFTRDQTYSNVESLALDPNDPQVIYAAGGNSDPSVEFKTALLKSTDQGATWKVLKTDLYMNGNGDLRTGGERLAVDPNRSSTLLFGSRRQGLWRSSDAGTTWTQVAVLPEGGDPQGVGWVAFDPTSGTAGASSQRLWVGIGKEGVFQSDDAGATWRNIFGAEIPGYYMGDVSVTARGSLYASFLKPVAGSPNKDENTHMDDGKTPNGVYRLERGVWTNISPDRAMNFDGVSALTVNGVDRVLVTPWDSSYQWRKPFSSEDGGSSWARIDFNDGDVKGQEGWLTLGFQAFGMGAALDPFNPNRAWALGGLGVWRTDDYRSRDASGNSSAQWTTQSRGMAETVDITAKSLPNGHLITGVADFSGFVYTDLDTLPSDRSRHETPIFTYTSIDALSSDPDFLVAVGQDQNHWYDPNRVFAGFSTNGGYDWQRFTSIPDASSGPARVGRVALSSGDKNNIVWAHAGAGIYATLDGGKSWKRGVLEGTDESFDALYWLNGGFTNTYLSGEPLAADKVNPKTFYAYGNINGYKSEVYRSSDGGLTWKVSSPFSDGAWEGGAQLRTAPGRAREIWIARGGKGLWRSKDGAVKFSKFAAVSSAQGLAFGKSASGRGNATVFLAGVVNGQEGIWRTTDEGLNWQKISSAAQNVLTGNFFNIEGDASVFGRVYIVTGGRGTFYGQPN